MVAGSVARVGDEGRVLTINLGDVEGAVPNFDVDVEGYEGGAGIVGDAGKPLTGTGVFEGNFEGDLGSSLMGTIVIVSVKSATRLHRLDRVN